VIYYSRCPHCGERSRINLRPGQVCRQCESNRIWEAGRTIRITREEVKEQTPLPAEPELPRSAWAWLLAVPFTLALGVSYLLHQFFNYHAEDSPSCLNWLYVLVSCAVGLGALAITFSLGGVFHARRKGYLRRRFIQAAGVGGLALASASLLVALTFWFLTVRVSFEPVARESHFVRTLPDWMRKSMPSTAVITAWDSRGWRFQPDVTLGAVVASGESRAWVLTAAHPDGAMGGGLASYDAVWVVLADGRALKGGVRLLPRTLNLALVEVALSEPPPAVEIHPAADGLIPGVTLHFIPNPSRRRWVPLDGRVLDYERTFTPLGSCSRVVLDFPIRPDQDIGGGLFDDEGRLVALTLGGADGEESAGSGAAASRAVTLPSGFIRRLADAAREGRLEQFLNLSSEVLQ
jgi:hypothetical protein